MTKLKVIIPFLFVALMHLQTLRGQGFSPIASYGVSFSTTATPEEGRHRLIVGMMTGSDGLPIGGYAFYKDIRKEWVNPDTVTDHPLFVQNNGIIGRTYNGQMMMISYDKYTRPHRGLLLFEWALQGSMLIEDGKKLKIANTEKAYYSAIGFREDGSVVIFNTQFEPVTLKTFVKNIQLYNPYCENVMLLDAASAYAFIRPYTDREQVLMGTDPSYAVDRIVRNDMAANDGKMKIHFVDFTLNLWTN